jgi:antitoxin VapB
MRNASVFMNGRSQAVRLPREYRVKGKSLAITRVGDMVIPRRKGWDVLEQGLGMFAPDFMMARSQPVAPDKREEL